MKISEALIDLLTYDKVCYEFALEVRDITELHDSGRQWWIEY